MLRKVVLSWLVIFACGHVSHAQMFENVELTSFGGRIQTPITVRVDQTGNTISFYAENKSYYPYEFEITFNRLVNLIPRTAGEKRVLRHGMTRVLKLTIENDELQPDFQYSIRWKLGDPSKVADHSFTYLIPLAQGTTFDRHTAKEGATIHYYLNAFKAQPGDTVFAMRKGLVAALPDSKQAVDRLKEGSLEIIHEDGSVALYRNIDKSLVSYNDEVLPGDPIGIINNAGFVSVGVYAFSESRVRQIDARFAVDEVATSEFKDLTVGLTVKHPASVCEKELSSKEIKKFRKSRK